MALADKSVRRGESFYRRIRERWEKFKDKINAVLYPISSPFLGLQPAYASVSSSFSLPMPIRDDFNRPQISYFDTGPLPPKSSVSDSILRGESVEIYYPHEITPEIKNSGKPYITIQQAQEEVERLLSHPASSHQYLVYEAVKLCGVEEAQRYMLHLLVGALAEDYVFRQGEEFADIFYRGYKSFIERTSRKELLVPLEELLPPHEKPLPGFFEEVVKVVAKIFRKLIKKEEYDELNRPYMAHFYDPTKKYNTGLCLLGNEICFQSALDRILQYWDSASELYEKKDKPRAFYQLGHILHLVCDLHVPAHVHNDPHGPTWFLGKLDSFEQWCKRCDYPDIRRHSKKPNIRIWDSGPLAPLEPPKNWNKYNIKEKLPALIDIIVSYTQLFRSVDRPGTRADQMFKGKLTDEECYKQGEELIPRAIQNSAYIISIFLYVYGTKKTDNKADNKETPPSHSFQTNLC
ncbi:MAG: hypothetical protein QXF70_03030 [Candidatus Bilamarchaeaceae archaeon]